ncbi:N-acetyltransferase family 8 member 3-like isoform X2 [Astyanax mexicanus]|uniref:N-acetyltransferase family 8 member 3-like isoform X1 n=1 Tax=Astyanax mexicanus TaxID=7994 RepID=UPI0020CB5330|nr:N-acetyltransferase family 8 member 3-like isoform X1 [Astyanax mexicanus]XP_049335467.1 N-acetyltransferase family 8 member 3-like isoform X2 [Astyanax mexicanus]
MQIVIRKFKPSDYEAVRAIFRDGLQEHINPSFIFAVSQLFHITLTLCCCAVGYWLGGESVGVALLAGCCWIGLVYVCCYEFYSRYVRMRLRTDMQDITASYLSHPDNCFWVAEAEVNGRPQVVGMVAVEAKKHPESGQKYAELFRMIVSPAARRTGLGSRLGQTAENFCKERGLSRIVLNTTSTQTAALALYKKMGYRLIQKHEDAESPWWVVRLTRAKVHKMEKILGPNLIQ